MQQFAPLGPGRVLELAQCKQQRGLRTGLH